MGEFEPCFYFTLRRTQCHLGVWQHLYQKILTTTVSLLICLLPTLIQGVMVKRPDSLDHALAIQLPSAVLYQSTYPRKK